MISGLKWITFCSQTGGEILRLSSMLRTSPDLFVTNRWDKLSRGVIEWLDSNRINTSILLDQPSVDDYLKLERDFKGALITLHGYTRILPKEFIFKCPKIYNGHPGLITKYPELKGLDPQKKAYLWGMTEVGSVIHRVIQEVDEGEVLCEDIKIISEKSDLEDYFINLKECSMNTWMKFFGEKLYL